MDELDKSTVSVLKKICQEEGISNYKKLKKRELISHIRLNRINNIVNDGLKKLNELN
jgi:ATP-dependent helicase/DNAse subunit B